MSALRFLLIAIGLGFCALSVAASTPKHKPSDVYGITAIRAEHIELGKRLFNDKRLSADGTISCASCHKPDNFFVDGKPVVEGISAQKGTRN